ncbi:hypothetical protein ACJX0J_030499, partial [Zea mays]
GDCRIVILGRNIKFHFGGEFEFDGHSLNYLSPRGELTNDNISLYIGQKDAKNDYEEANDTDKPNDIIRGVLGRVALWLYFHQIRYHDEWLGYNIYQQKVITQNKLLLILFFLARYFAHDKCFFLL